MTPLVSQGLQNTAVTARDITLSRIDRREGVAFLHVLCPHTSMGYCEFKVWRKPARVPDLRWHWDGSEHAPTISPSVDCKGGCGRHFTVTSGVPS